MTIPARYLKVGDRIMIDGGAYTRPGEMIEVDVNHVALGWGGHSDLIRILVTPTLYPAAMRTAHVFRLDNAVRRTYGIQTRFYCDTIGAPQGRETYVVRDRRSMLPNHIIARFRYASDAEDFRDLKRSQAGVK